MVFMITRQQLKVFNLFRNGILKEWTFKGIKKALKESSNNKLQTSLKHFEKEGLIKLKRVGKTNLYSLNLKNNKTFEYLSICFLEFCPNNIPIEVLYKVQEAVIKTTDLFSLLVFGSFSKGEATKNSDIDVAVIVENEETKKQIVPSLESVRRRELTDIHCNVFTNDEFLEMLLIEQENVGKEIFRNHFIFYNPISFYKMVMKGVEHGFRG